MTPRYPSSRRLARFLPAALPLLLGILALTGCEDNYSTDVRYPLRTDWLIEKPPTEQPTRYNPPGVLPLYVLDNPDTTLFGPDHHPLGERGLMKERDTAKIIFDPRELSPDTKTSVSLAIRELAGRPRVPKIDLNGSKYDELNDKLVKQLKLDRKTLAEGSKLYRRNCLHCHGVSGDGKGPTGAWVNPPPRDYRQGIFKFTSSSQAQGERKPRRDDLKRLLLTGIEGTSMPSFHLLKAEEIDALVSYVIHLSIRGQAEYVTLMDLVKEAKGLATATGEKIYQRVRDNAEQIADQWLKAQESEIKPVKIPEYKNEQEKIESAARGFRIFSIKEQGGCIQCHLNIGRDAQFFYDAWGTVVRPRNLYTNQMRGGRRPIDLYWRLHAGINGAGMPALITNDADLAQKEEWIWDLVSFVQLAPYRDKRVLIQDQLNKLQEKLPADQPRVNLPID